MRAVAGLGAGIDVIGRLVWSGSMRGEAIVVLLPPDLVP